MFFLMFSSAVREISSATEVICRFCRTARAALEEPHLKISQNNDYATNVEKRSRSLNVSM